MSNAVYEDVKIAEERMTPSLCRTDRADLMIDAWGGKPAVYVRLADDGFFGDAMTLDAARELVGDLMHIIAVADRLNLKGGAES
jgi:hypothetical protein